MNRNWYASPLFVLIGVLFVTFLLISNIIAGKLITAFGFVFPAAVILFPLTYIFADVLTEVYGFERSRLIIWSGFLCNIIMSVIFIIVVALPYPSFWSNQSAYFIVLGLTPRIVIASLLAYLAGEFTNSIILSKMKVLTHGKWLFTRTIGSTIVGEAIDTIIFIGIAFIGTISLQILFQMMMAQYFWKVLYEVIATPLTYKIVRWVKDKEKMDVYDHDVSYNPFSLRVSTSKE